ncbi:MAG: hypothetical protein E7675_07410 [Ruminococcaceae bacterium]|nr:hypothetical protein [Oscillospiraceae bacterium]
MLNKKNLLIGFLIIISSIALGSCAASSPIESSPVIVSSGTECTIVYANSSSDYIVRQVKSLEKQIEEYCGSFVTLKSDWNYSSDSTKENGTVEILFGKTNCPESIEVYSSLPENGYIIKEVNGKIVIAATSEKLLRAASLRFFSTYFSLSSGITVPGRAQIKEEDLPFFNIAYNGISDTKIIIPTDSSSELERLAVYAAQKINNKCNTKIQVVKDLPSISIKNSILITNNSKRLSNTESRISFVDSTLHIEGSNELSTINAISLFIDHVIHSCDKKNDGYYHIYFPKNELIADEWNYSIPIFPSGSFVGSECVANNSYSLQFSDIHEDDYRNYIEILKILGYTAYSSGENKGVSFANFKKDTTDIYMAYNTEKSSATLLISGNVFNS